MAEFESKTSVKPSATKAVVAQKFEYLNDYKDAIASENVRVVLLIGNDRSPSRMEVQLNDVAQEIKAQFSA